MPKRQRQKVEASIPDGMYTVDMILEKTGISPREMNLLIRQGKLKVAGRTGRNWMLYDDVGFEVVQQYLKARDRGETGERVRIPRMLKNDPNIAYATDEAVRVLDLLEKGKNVREIFLETRIHPSMIYAILKDMEQLAGFMIFTDEQVKKLQTLQIEGARTARTFEDFFKMMLKVTLERRCQSCGKKRRSTMCTGCVRAMHAENAELDEDEATPSPADSEQRLVRTEAQEEAAPAP